MTDQKPNSSSQFRIQLCSGEVTPPAPETGRTIVATFAYREGGQDVRATIRMRWELDPLFGLGTVWWVDCTHPPFSLDGEADGLLSVDSVVERVAAQHHASDLSMTALPLPSDGSH